MTRILIILLVLIVAVVGVIQTSLLDKIGLSDQIQQIIDLLPFIPKECRQIH